MNWDSSLTQLPHHSHSLAASDAQGGYAISDISAAHLADELDGDDATGGPYGVAHGDTAAVDVDDLLIQAKLSNTGHRLRGKRLV